MRGLTCTLIQLVKASRAFFFAVHRGQSGIFGQQSHQIRNYSSQNTSLSLASNPNKTQNPSRKYVIKTPDMSLSGISRFAILSLRTLLVCTNETGLYQCHCREIKNGCNLEIIIFSQSDREHFLDLDALYPL